MISIFIKTNQLPHFLEKSQPSPSPLSSSPQFLSHPLSITLILNLEKINCSRILVFVLIIMLLILSCLTLVLSLFKIEQPTMILLQIMNFQALSLPISSLISLLKLIIHDFSLVISPQKFSNPHFGLELLFMECLFEVHFIPNLIFFPLKLFLHFKGIILLRYGLTLRSFLRPSIRDLNHAFINLYLLFLIDFIYSPIDYSLNFLINYSLNFLIHFSLH